MHLFNNFGIAKRLYLVSFILIAALATVAISGWVGLKEDARLAERVGTVRTPQLMRIAAVELNVTRVSLQIRHAILARSDVELRQTLADITEKGKLIDEALKGLGRPAHSGRARYIRQDPAAGGIVLGGRRREHRPDRGRRQGSGLRDAGVPDHSGAQPAA